MAAADLINSFDNEVTSEENVEKSNPDQTKEQRSKSSDVVTIKKGKLDYTRINNVNQNNIKFVFGKDIDEPSQSSTADAVYLQQLMISEQQERAAAYEEESNRDQRQQHQQSPESSPPPTTSNMNQLVYDERQKRGNESPHPSDDDHHHHHHHNHHHHPHHHVIQHPHPHPYMPSHVVASSSQQQHQQQAYIHHHNEGLMLYHQSTGQNALTSYIPDEKAIYICMFMSIFISIKFHLS